MANLSDDEVRLQLAVAFGQGTGTIPTSPEALSFALEQNTDLIRRAQGEWATWRFAFLDLVKRLGQVSATLAIMDRQPEIGRKHVEEGLQVVIPVCPCGPLRR